jgi:hypothetical protein
MMHVGVKPSWVTGRIIKNQRMQVGVAAASNITISVKNEELA